MATSQLDDLYVQFVRTQFNSPSDSEFIRVEISRIPHLRMVPYYKPVQFFLLVGRADEKPGYFHFFSFTQTLSHSPRANAVNACSVPLHFGQTRQTQTHRWLRLWERERL